MSPFDTVSQKEALVAYLRDRCARIPYATVRSKGGSSQSAGEYRGRRILYIHLRGV